jgi:hypothetical protein
MSIYDTLNRLKEQWERVPDWRLMQLISNFQSYIGSDGFYIPNEDLVERIEIFLNDVLNKEEEE